MAEVIRTPELRFPEFESNWDAIRLGEIGEFKNGINKGKSDFGFGHPFVNLMDVFGETLLDSSINLGLVNASDTELINYQLNEGDVLFIRSSVKRAGVGETIVVDETLEKTVYSGFLIRFRDNDFISKGFKKYCFWTKKFRNQLISFSSTSANTNINQESLVSLRLNVPSKQEQLKIAAFLTAVDERIQLLQKKKAKLEEYKKGVMQQLFSQQIRFNDENGNEFPDWEEKKLGEIGATFNGLTGKTKVDFGEGMPYVQYMQIFSNSKINVQEFGLVKIDENESQSKVQYGDVFFTTSSETPNEIGTASVMLEEVQDVYLNSFCFGFRPNSLTELVPQFSRYLFRSELFRREIIKLAQGSTRFNMSKVELMKLRVIIPEEDEQIKIANFLTSLDDSIELIGVEIDGSIEYKQGLLQKMFV